MNNTDQTEKKFRITVQRNQISEVEIEVEATNDSDAMDKAMELAENGTDADGFALEWDDVDYTFEGTDIECDEDDDNE
jgi:hypothetical protein